MTHRIVDFNAWIDDVRRINRARKLKAKRLATREPTDGLVLSRTMPSGWIVGAAITPEGNFWRISRFDINGFFGHGLRDTKELCILDCLKDGYRDTNRDLLKQVSLLDSFDIGNEITTRNQRLMARMES